MLAKAGRDSLGECIAIAPSAADGQHIVCRNVPGGAVADLVLTQWRGEWLLLPVSAAADTQGIYRPQASASLQWQSADAAVFRLREDDADIVALCNAAHAAAHGRCHAARAGDERRVRQRPPAVRPQPSASSRPCNRN
ncbi:hypothetical protein ACU4GD_20510 [Cupriavidus basilensis]